MPPYTISKSDFISGAQCPLYLWLKKHRSDACTNTETDRTDEGEAVGALAKLYFPDAVEVPLARASIMAKDTQMLLQDTPITICEATFMSKGLSCSTDIVHYDGQVVDIIEVKSSSSVKDVQLWDLAFQAFVIRSAGYQLRSASIMHINKEYKRGAELDIHQLLKLEDKTTTVLQMATEVEAKIATLQPLCRDTLEPTVAIGPHCERPYECPCKAYCRQLAGVPKESVFDAPGLSTAKKYELYSRGYVALEQLRNQVGLLTPGQQATVDSMFPADDGILYINHRRLEEFLGTIRYPLYHLDFETYQRAIPPFEQMMPYEQIPFQYSLHVQKEQLALPRHEEFLGIAGSDTRRALAERLCQDIPMGAQSIAYNRSFEASVLRRLAEIFPDLAPHLRNIAENLIDLMVPFKKKWVTSPDMHGSYSIKSVLPALCGTPPELDYQALPGPHNGKEASAAFIAMATMTDPVEINNLRQGLLKYCGLDTMGMVCVLNKLYELV